MTGRILDHFWLAIQKGDLEVEIEGTKIDSRNIESNIFNFFDLEDVYRKDEQNPIPYFLAYKKGQLFEKTLPTIGKVRCRILAAEGYPNQMYCVRSTGMKIEQRDFRSVVQYAGVFECDNEKGNEILKLLEPPNHDKWSLNNSNAKDPEGEPLPEAKKAYEEFYRFCRECVSSLIHRNDREALSIGGLERYLHLPSAAEEIMDSILEAELDKTKISDHETGSEGGFMDEQRPIVMPPRKLSVTNKKDSGDTDGGKAITLKPGDNPPPPKKGGRKGTKIGSEGAETGSEGEGEEKIWLAADAKHRAFVVEDKDSGAQHVIYIRGTKNKEYFVRLMVGTDDNYAKIPIDSVVDMHSQKALLFSDNLIRAVMTDTSGTAQIAVKFKDGQQYSLNVGIYEG